MIVRSKKQTPPRRKVVLRRPPINAIFDNAQTTNDNYRHWANADTLSPNSAANPAVRATLRSRSRYELGNNSYGNGMLRTYANDVIGKGGPTLDLPLEDKERRQFAELKFKQWAKSIHLMRKLRVTVKAIVRDGEAVVLLKTPAKSQNLVKLDIQPIECDRLTTPDSSFMMKENATDGIVFDVFGNPIEYHILRKHPGESSYDIGMYEYDKISAEFVIHLYDMERPEQSRGLPRMTPSLSQLGQIRQFRQAVLGSARTGANISLFMKTTLPPDSQAASVDPLTTMEMEPNLAVFAPEGWEPFQMKPAEVTTSVKEFTQDVVTEAARPLHMPRNIALGDSSDYNYASGRMDHQTYYKGIDVERNELEDECLDRIFEAWVQEAELVYPELSGLSEEVVDIEPTWMWGGREHVDPTKESSAQDTHLLNGTTTLAEIGAEDGVSWLQRMIQRGIEVQMEKELGIRPEIVPPGEDEEDGDEDEDDEDKDEEDEDDDDDSFGGNGNGKKKKKAEGMMSPLARRILRDYYTPQVRT